MENTIGQEKHNSKEDEVMYNMKNIGINLKNYITLRIYREACVPSIQ